MQSPLQAVFLVAQTAPVLSLPLSRSEGSRLSLATAKLSWSVRVLVEIGRTSRSPLPWAMMSAHPDRFARALLQRTV